MQIQARKLTLINQGSSSEIYRYGCLQKGVVLKVVPTSCVKQARHLANEFKILSTLNHQNIVKALKYKQKINLNGTGANKQLETCKNVLVIESASQGNLLDFYKKARPSMNQIRWIFAELGEATRYLHCNYIVHRDLKLENVLVCQNQESQIIQIKIADFGFATNAKNSSLSNAYKGTKRGFMAPEIHFLMKDSQWQYDMYKADIFSLGVILFTLVLGRLPFEYATFQNSHYSLIAQKKYNNFWKMHEQAFSRLEESQGSMIEDFKQIFIRMVQEDASKRPSIQEVLECSWLSGRQEIIKSMKKVSESSTTN